MRVRVELCSTGQLIDTSSKELSFHVRFEPPTGDSGGYISPVLWKNDTMESTPWLVYPNPDTGAGDPGSIPEGWLYQAGEMTDLFPFAEDHLATHVGFTILFGLDWKGTIYLDDIRLE